MKLEKIINLQMNLIDQLSENLEEEKCINQVTWGVDLADVQLISKYNKGIKYLLCVIDIFSKYTWVVPLKDKKRVTIFNAFQNAFQKSNRKTK